MSSIYNVSDAQAVESGLVTSHHPETGSHVQTLTRRCLDGCARMLLCVSLLVAYVNVGPDLIDVSGGSPVCQQDLL